MKKLLAIFLTICMLASTLCIPAFAEEPVSGVVLRVSALKTNGDTEVLGDYNNFEDGWNAAMDIAGNTSTMKTMGYDRIVVDIYKDWVATDGVFTDDWWSNGPGFDWDTIYFPDDSRVTLNMNGHKIDRDLQTWELDGEVLHVDEDADVIINNGTITGGWSRNGGGGIYLDDDATLVLNDVHIKDNRADIDNGGGISICDGATLIMNGGSFENNVADSGFSKTYLDALGGAIYATNATIKLTGVEFNNNRVENQNTHGAAIYAKNCEIEMDNCNIVGNGKNEVDKDEAANSVFYFRKCTVTIKNSTFTDNNTFYWKYTTTDMGNITPTDETSIFYLNDSAITIDNCTFTNNNSCYIFYTYFSNDIYATNSTFTDNTSIVLPFNWATEESYFRNCTFNNNNITDSKMIDRGDGDDFYTTKATFYDCDFGDSTFGVDNPKIVNSDSPNGSQYGASIFGEGSLTMIIAFTALIAAVASLLVNISAKKKAVPAAAANAAEDEDEDEE